MFVTKQSQHNFALDIFFSSLLSRFISPNIPDRISFCLLGRLRDSGDVIPSAIKNKADWDTHSIIKFIINLKYERVNAVILFYDKIKVVGKHQ
jgi:hypothetical protein